jgi:kumamolisin
MKTIHNSVVTLPQIGHSTKWGVVNSVEQHHLNQEMDLQFHFDIDPSKQTELETRANNNEVISLDELRTKYSPDQIEVNKLINWLNQNGYYSIRQSVDMCSIYATSKVDNISKTLNCNMVTIKNENETHVGAQNAPTLPISVSKNLNTINGLQPYRMFQKKSSMLQATNRNMVFPEKASRNINTQAIFNKQITNIPPYTPAEILKAYNNNSNFTGIGQTIGILIDVFPKTTDLVNFWRYCGVNTNSSRVTFINVRNVRMGNPTGEETLDTEWTSSIAPNANIRVYGSGDLYFVHLDQAIDKMISDISTIPSMKQISISLGLGEKEMSSGEITTENAKFLRLKTLGVNVFISSGDGGSNPDNILQVEYASCNPNVVSVGGTTLVLSATGSVSSETAWNGSGGGVSTLFTKPTYQLATGTGRLVPDVSAIADPNYGALVILNGRSYQFGGTSLSAPIWAGICALINDARKRNGNRSPIGFLPPYIYPFVSTNKFRDITSGSNGSYSSSVGYDKVTGLGSPNITNLISALMSV